MNELVKKYLNRNCTVTLSGYGEAAKGTITEVNDNWIIINTKNGDRLINLDYVEMIREITK